MSHRWFTFNKQRSGLMFQKVSRFKNNRLREFHDSISLFGFDFKITPNTGVRLIEINGINSGMKGFERAYSEDVELQVLKHIKNKADKMKVPTLAIIYPNHKKEKIKKARIIPVNYSDLKSVAIDPQKTRIYSFNRSPYLGYKIGPTLEVAVEEPKPFIKLQRAYKGRFPVDTAIRNSRFSYGNNTYEKDLVSVIINYDTDLNVYEGNQLVINSASVEQFVNFKHLLTKFQIPFAANSQIFKREQLEFLLKAKNFQQLLIKPNDGVLGDGISIFENVNSNSDLIDQLISKTELETFLVQEFIPSKPIKSKETGELHDGCMRYIAVASHVDNKLEITHFGGYWRLNPNPINAEVNPTEKFVDNLAKGAIPQPCTKEEQEIALKAVNEILRTNYDTMLGYDPYDYALDAGF